MIMHLVLPDALLLIGLIFTPSLVYCVGLSLCVRVCVCVCVCVHACMHESVYVCVCVCVFFVLDCVESHGQLSGLCRHPGFHMFMCPLLNWPLNQSHQSISQSIICLEYHHSTCHFIHLSKRGQGVMFGFRLVPQSLSLSLSCPFISLILSLSLSHAPLSLLFSPSLMALSLSNS